jgi:membrane-associated phospholipid phosphatase
MGLVGVVRRTLMGSRYLREPIILLLAYIPYFVARGQAVSNGPEAFQHAQHLARVETSVGIFQEISLQTAAIPHSLLIHAFNIIYFYGHWPVIIGCGLYLFFRKPDAYVITRNAFLISGAVALLLYVFYPVAPPRLSVQGVTDTLAMTVPVSLDKSRLVNPYAALPSLHVGWNVLIVLGLFIAMRQWPLRLCFLFLPPLMVLATVITGNHFFIDGMLGGLLAVLAFYIALRLEHRRRLRQFQNADRCSTLLQT